MASVACKLLTPPPFPAPLACLVVITLITATFASLACILHWCYLHSACDNRKAEAEAVVEAEAEVEPAVRIGWSDGTFAWPPPEAVRLPNIWQDK